MESITRFDLLTTVSVTAIFQQLSGSSRKRQPRPKSPPSTTEGRSFKHFWASQNAKLIARCQAGLTILGSLVSRLRTARRILAEYRVNMPVAPKIEATLSPAEGNYTIRLQSPQLARSVYISFGDLDVESSDNYFDLLPGEPATVTLKSAATTEQLRGALKVISLTDAFAAN